MPVINLCGVNAARELSLSALDRYCSTFGKSGDGNGVAGLFQDIGAYVRVHFNSMPADPVSRAPFRVFDVSDVELVECL